MPCDVRFTFSVVNSVSTPELAFFPRLGSIESLPPIICHQSFVFSGQGTSISGIKFKPIKSKLVETRVVKIRLPHTGFPPCSGHSTACSDLDF